jgi:dolichol-phosphate mannosyltransferase
MNTVGVTINAANNSAAANNPGASNTSNSSTASFAPAVGDNEKEAVMILAENTRQLNKSKGKPPEISVIIPVFNEEDNISLLYEKLVQALEELGRSWEAIIIDDGSSDQSYNKLADIAREDDRIKVVRFVRNFGQTAALAAGIDNAHGDVIIPMDADLQNDPADVKRLLAKLDEGYDCVSGWRKDRKDELFLRLIPSWTANRIISWISGVKLHDYGCSLKAYRKEVIKDVRLYGEMHRFVPIYASWLGAKVTEIPVNHEARKYGQSKYGISRTFKVVLDLITVKFMATYFTKPIYLFGSAGMAAIILSFIIFGWMVVLKYCYHTSFIETPLPILAGMFAMMGVNMIFQGLQSEMQMRTYHESQGKRIYKIKTSINLEGDLD